MRVIINDPNSILASVKYIHSQMKEELAHIKRIRFFSKILPTGGDENQRIKAVFIHILFSTTNLILTITRQHVPRCDAKQIHSTYVLLSMYRGCLDMMDAP